MTDLTVAMEGQFVVAERAADPAVYVAERVNGALVARYRFGLRRAALSCRDELARGETA